MCSASVSRVAPVGVFTCTHWPKTMLPSFHNFQYFLNPGDHITNTDHTEKSEERTTTTKFTSLRLASTKQHEKENSSEPASDGQCVGSRWLVLFYPVL